jgi:hypothetical protein
VAQELHVSTRKSRPHLLLSNGYPKLISYLEARNFTFKPIIPLRSNSGLECDPTLRKCSPRTTRLRSQIKTTSTTLKWVSKVDFIFRSGKFTFQPIIQLRSKLGLECDPKLRKCGPRTTRLRSQIKTMSTALKWISKVDFIFGSKEFYFSTHNPTSFKVGPGM